MKKLKINYYAENLFPLSIEREDLPEGNLIRFESEGIDIILSKEEESIILKTNSFTSKITGVYNTLDYLKVDLGEYYREKTRSKERCHNDNLYIRGGKFYYFEIDYLFGSAIKNTTLIEYNRDSSKVKIVRNSECYFAKIYDNDFECKVIELPDEFFDKISDESDLVNELRNLLNKNKKSDKLVTIVQLSKLLECSEEEAERRFDELIRVETVDETRGLNRINTFTK